MIDFENKTDLTQRVMSFAMSLPQFTAEHVWDRSPAHGRTLRVRADEVSCFEAITFKGSWVAFDVEMPYPGWAKVVQHIEAILKVFDDTVDHGGASKLELHFRNELTVPQGAELGDYIWQPTKRPSGFPEKITNEVVSGYWQHDAISLQVGMAVTPAGRVDRTRVVTLAIDTLSHPLVAPTSPAEIVEALGEHRVHIYEAFEGLVLPTAKTSFG